MDFGERWTRDPRRPVGRRAAINAGRYGSQWLLRDLAFPRGMKERARAGGGFERSILHRSEERLRKLEGPMANLRITLELLGTSSRRDPGGEKSALAEAEGRDRRGQRIAAARLPRGILFQDAMKQTQRALEKRSRGDTDRRSGIDDAAREVAAIRRGR